MKFDSNDISYLKINQMMKLSIIFLSSVIFAVNGQTLDSATQQVLDEISNLAENLFSDNPVYNLKDEVTFFLANR